MPTYLARLPESSYNGEYGSKAYLEDELIPPALPRQLEKPFMNQGHVNKDDQSVLPMPAHVCRVLEYG